MEQYEGLYIKSYHSEETDYNIHFVFWWEQAIRPLYKKVTWYDNEDMDCWWFQFNPPEGREVYIYMNTYSDWVTNDKKKLVSREQFYMDTIIHETIHCVQRMFDYLQRPVDYNECEPFAYYASYWIRKWLQFVEEIKSLDNY